MTESDLRRYGTPTDHRKAHGLDAAGIRSFVMQSIAAPQPPQP